MRIVLWLSFAAVAIFAPAAGAYEIAEKSIATLQADLTAGKVTSEQLVALYLQRIEAVDVHGPALHSVIMVNPAARTEAQRLDQERRQGKIRSALHGIPILLKDNIETVDPAVVGIGSTALADNVSHRDAFLAARLRSAGAIVIG